MLDVTQHDGADDAVELDEVERTSRCSDRIVDRVHFLDERGDQGLLRREVIGEIARTEVELAREVAHADCRDAPLVESATGVLENSSCGSGLLQFRTLT